MLSRKWDENRIHHFGTAAGCKMRNWAACAPRPTLFNASKKKFRCARGLKTRNSERRMIRRPVGRPEFEPEASSSHNVPNEEIGQGKTMAP